MKKTLLLAILSLALFNCKQEAKPKDYKGEALDVTTSVYPEHVSKIFDAHGGIDRWNTFNKLYFEIENEGANEKTTVALKNRASLIDAEHYLLGYDGKDIWLKEKDTVKYKSNPKFYYNLMFYFYAMPFVLGDDGIHYKDVEPLEYEGVSYPGILISYDNGVGESSDDEYILYYHPETHQMEWLAYTVTFFSKEKSKKFSLIKYDQWGKLEGLSLPTTLQWFKYEDGVIGDMRNELKFVNSKLNTKKPEDSFFAPKDNAKIIE
jgi:hypothetical protein